VSTTSLVRRAVLLMFRRVRQPHVGFGVGEAPCLLDVVPFDCHQIDALRYELAWLWMEYQETSSAWIISQAWTSHKARCDRG
jgi:hypothetical protein